MSEFEYNGSKWTPRGSLVAIELDADWGLQGGIALPETHKSATVAGYVRGVGPGAEYNGRRETMLVESGDRVIIREYHSLTLTEHLRLVTQDQLDCVLLPPEADPTLPKVRPLHDRIILSEWTPIVPESVLLPDSVQADLYYGTVALVGPGIADEFGDPRPVGIEPGDTVIFRRWSAMPLSYNGVQDFLIIRPSHVVGRK